MESFAEHLAGLPVEERLAVLDGIDDDELDVMLWDWSFWGRPEQQEPKGDEWSIWLYLAGRGAGKTRAGSEWVRKIVCGETPLATGRVRRLALVAETAADARDVLVEGDSGILSVHPRDFRPHYEPSKRRLTWPNGATATMYNAVEPDQLPLSESSLDPDSPPSVSGPRPEAVEARSRSGFITSPRVAPPSPGWPSK